MSDEPSPGELRRLYDQLREDNRRAFSDLNARLDRMPTAELLMAHLAGWQTQLDAMKEDIAEIKADRERDTSRRYLILTGVLVPIALSLIAIAAATGVIG